MRLSDFDYKVPVGRTAQFPLADRAQAKLMIIDRTAKSLEHRKFYELPQFLKSGDVLVFNNTRVFPARIFGSKPSGGKIEVLLVQAKKKNLWACLIKPASKVKNGSKITLGNGIEAEVRKGRGERYFEIEFKIDRDVFELLEDIGAMPLPHYIKRPATEEDKENYQTVYAEKIGSIAAPTAGLHFTNNLIGEIEAKGRMVAKITLHIGPGTFLPIRHEDISKHNMVPEYYEISDEAKNKIESAQRVIAVGTSSARVLESATQDRKIINQRGWTDLFIYPVYKFKMVDALITNFHLPKGTPLLLTAAFAGKEFLFKAYDEAIKSDYRLFSYGDAMLIL